MTCMVITVRLFARQCVDSKVKAVVNQVSGSRRESVDVGERANLPKNAMSVIHSGCSWRRAGNIPLSMFYKITAYITAKILTGAQK